MKTRDLFSESMKEKSSLKWKDILSQSFVKHSQLDIEQMMQVGTLSRKVPESQMLQTWHRPWLWWTVAKYGLALVAVLYVLLFVLSNFFALSNSLFNMAMIIPPIVVPAIIMIFLWELNVPQNISFMQLWIYFLVAGIINFAVTSILFLVWDTGLPASYAAFREEPAKLMAALAILFYLQKVKKQKIYGITGLVVGGISGTAFSAIESVSYAINNSGTAESMVYVQILRSVLALGGHIVWCAAYTTAITMKNQNGKITAKSFLNPMFLGSFALSVALHYTWNSSGLIVNFALMAANVAILLYWIRTSFSDIVKGKPVSMPAYAEAGKAVPVITVTAQSSGLVGMSWKSQGEALVIGRQRDKCTVCYPESTKGVSRAHCQILKKDGIWYVQDLKSSCGTYIRGRRLNPYEYFPVRSGDVIYLGSKQVWLTVS